MQGFHLAYLRRHATTRTLRVCAGRLGPLEGTRLLLEYCDLAEADKTPIRMVRGHSFSLIGVSLA